MNVGDMKFKRANNRTCETQGRSTAPLHYEKHINKIFKS